MSLHAQLSPEAIARLEAQKRSTTIGSLFIALLVVLLISLVLGLFLLPAQKPPVVDFVPFPVDVEEPEEIDPVDRPKVTEVKPSAPRVTLMKFIASTQPAEMPTLVPDVMTPEPSFDFGTSEEFGDGIGDFPSDPSFPRIPPNDPIGNRCSKADRLKRLKETGGSIEGERAVVKALDYLKGTQNADGSWGDKYKSAMTGFAVLAYLGHCEHQESRKYGDTVSKGLIYLIDLGMKNDGKLTVMPDNSIQWVYEHAIATYALAEAQTFSKILRSPFPNLEKTTKKAGEIIMDGQADSGGWNYRYGNSPNQGDNSVGFWQIQALKACKHTGVWPDAKFNRTTRNATDFLKKVQSPEGAVGYRLDPKRSPQLTGGAVLCMQIWGEGDGRAAKKGAEWIHKNSTFKWGTPSANLYYHYYNAQAMINAGGDHWDWYNEMFRDQLIKAQSEDGSWTQKMAHGPINQHMATCLATLTLEVYYRFLPGANK